MNPYIDKLKAYLDEREVNYCDSAIRTILEFLWNTYTYLKPDGNDLTRKKLDELEPISRSISFDNANLLYDTISDLCAELERLAFIEGIRVGARLMIELDMK